MPNSVLSQLESRGSNYTEKFWYNETISVDHSHTHTHTHTHIYIYIYILVTREYILGNFFLLLNKLLDYKLLDY